MTGGNSEKVLVRVLLVLSVLVFAEARPWDLYDPTLDHYTRAIRQVSSGKILRGIETARAAARHAPDSRDAWVNLSGFYLKLFNMEDYAEPVSHVQALELFAIANYGIANGRLPWEHPQHEHAAMVGLFGAGRGRARDVTLDGTETWRLPPDQSTGDRQSPRIWHRTRHHPKKLCCIEPAFRVDRIKNFGEIRSASWRASQNCKKWQRSERAGKTCSSNLLATVLYLYVLVCIYMLVTAAPL